MNKNFSTRNLLKRKCIVITVLVLASIFGVNSTITYAACGSYPSDVSLPNGGTGHTELCFDTQSYSGLGSTAQGAAAVSVDLTTFDVVDSGTCNYRTKYKSGYSYVTEQTSAASVYTCSGATFHVYYTNGTHWSIYGTGYTSSHT